MQSVYKYIVPLNGLTQIEVQGFLRWAACSMQNNQPTVWAVCDLRRSEWHKITLSVHGTGKTVMTDSQFVGTVFDDPFVWHIFEVKRLVKVSAPKEIAP